MRLLRGAICSPAQPRCPLRAHKVIKDHLWTLKVTDDEVTHAITKAILMHAEL